MLFPLQFQITSLHDLLNLPFRGLLSTSWYPVFPFELVPVAYASIVNGIGLNLAIGFMLALPAILFNYRLARIPANRSIRRLAAAALVVSGIMVYVAASIAVAILSSSAYYSYEILLNIEAFPTIAVGAFIVLPIIQRQAILIASSENMHSSPPETLQKHPKSGIGREVILATILWASLYFLPYLVVPTYAYYYGGTFEVFSFAYIMDAGYGGNVLAEYYPMFIYGLVVPLFSLPILGILSSLRFVFVRDIYRYLKHEINYRRLLYLGILADIFPVIAFTVMQGVIYPWSTFTYGGFPVPCLVVVGMLVTRLHRSVVPVANQIWKDVEARMWFEKEGKGRGVASVSEQPSHLEDEIITVPLTYMMVSHLRKRRHNDDSRRPNVE